MKKEQMVEKGSREYYERQVAMGRSTLFNVFKMLLYSFWK